MFPWVSEWKGLTAEESFSKVLKKFDSYYSKPALARELVSMLKYNNVKEDEYIFYFDDYDDFEPPGKVDFVPCLKKFLGRELKKVELFKVNTLSEEFSQERFRSYGMNGNICS